MNLPEMVSAIAGELLGNSLLNYKFLPAYILIIFLIKGRFDRFANFQRNIYGRPGKTGRRFIEEIILFGLVAGFIISLFVVFIGITIPIEAFQIMLFITVVLVLFNIRYICPAYAGGILSLGVLIKGYPAIDVSHVLMLIAFIHLMESGLIYFHGSKRCIPIIIKDEEGISGAFLTREFWPVPVVFLTFLAQTAVNGMMNLNINEWWTLLKPDVIYPGLLVLGLDCVILVPAYSDMTAADQPERKSRRNSFLFLGYSVILIIIAFLSFNIYAFKLIGALFCVLAHEAIILFGIHREKTAQSLFRPAKRGLKVLDVLKGSAADKMGLRRGDIILRINGRDIQTEAGMQEALRNFPSYTWVDVIDINSNSKTYEYKQYPEGINMLGIVTVPRETEVTYNIDQFEKLTILKNLVVRFRNFNKPM